MRDIVITLTYNGKQDVVKATAIWAVQTVNGFKNQNGNTLWPDAGEPLKTLFYDPTDRYRGKFGVQYFNNVISHIIGMEFRIIPSATAAEWDSWRVKFDVTRQKEKRFWVLQGGTFVVVNNPADPDYWPGQSSFTSTGPTGANVETQNDDAGANDEDSTPQNDHIYSIDAPGLSANNGAFPQVVARQNFLEFVRVSFNGTAPSGNNTSGSRCSPKIGWYMRLWVEQNAAGNAYQPRAGKPNDVALGYHAILPAPSP